MSTGSIAVSPALAAGRTKALRRVFLTARWQLLAMLNWQVDPALLEPLVPRGVELDFHDGKTYLSLVGFLFLDTRVLGVAIPGHRNFEEVNLRFYVRRVVGDEVRRGVVFLKEIVPRWAIAQAARACYNEPYVALPMRHEAPGTAADVLKPASGRRKPPDDFDPSEDGRVAYRWRFGGRWNSVEVHCQGRLAPPVPSSHEEFIAEHYWGYCGQRNGGTLEYHVEHPPWNVWPATDVKLDCDAAALFGRQFGPILSQPPATAFVADGSEVAVMRPVRIA
jgi:uncharacterized protein YqjF (DUF2071 family)